MAVDNRTTIDAADSNAAWSGDATITADSTIFYQGTASLRSQSTNSYRSWVASGSWDFTGGATIYMLSLPFAPDTKANGGVRMVLGDGTNRRAYFVGGSDDAGFPVAGGWRVYRLDTANPPASFSQDLGSNAPNFSAITNIGIGYLSTSKALGNVDNCWWDRFAYIANGSPAFTVNAGTSGTPINFSTLVSDDVTNGWGFFNNPISGSKQYGVFGAVEWGDTTASTASYFSDSDAQVYFIGTGLSANTMDQDFISNSGATNSFVLDNVVAVHVGEPANWNLDSTNFDVQKFDGCQFIDGGNFAFHTTSSQANRYVQGCQFIGCEQVNLKGTYTRDTAFKNTSDTVAALLWNNSIDIEDSSFENNTTGAGIEHPDWNGSASGTATNSGSETTTLFDSTASFTTTVAVNDIVYNETDGSFGTVSAIVSNTELTHSALSGGTNNFWTNSDAYSVATPYSYTNLTFSGNTNDVDNTTSPANVVAISKAGTSDPATFPSGDFVVIQGSVTVQVTVVDASNNPVELAQTAVYLNDGTEVMNKDTNASGVASTTYAGSTPASCYIRVRKSSDGDTKYIPNSTTGTIESGSGLSVTMVLREDSNA